ncbi:MAG: hypothetical protein KH452_02515 [Clostridiales bacterium]|nr:hypothetical protein [Clostridiales bacterium]
MQMILAAVLLVMAVLNVFLLFVIRQIVVITNRQVQRHFTVELESLGTEVEGMLERLAEARKELQETERKETAPQEAETTASVARGLSQVPGFSHPRYRSEESLETYRYIRDHMKLDYSDYIRQALASRPQPDQVWERLRDVMDKLDFQTMYGLLLMQDEERETVLERMLTKEEQAALEQAAPLDLHPDFSDRMDAARQYMKLHDPVIRVESGDPDVRNRPEEEGLRVEYNPQIHEGIRLHMGAGVLDYSL